jgi:hypothetical protein
VSLVTLLVGGGGFHLEELVDGAPFRRQLLHGREATPVSKSGGVTVVWWIQSGDRRALIPDVSALAI